MTDWREAGYRADAKRVLNLYRRSFDNDAKRLARTRSIEALRAAGVTTVVCLWGGGQDAEELVAAGFRVIAVDNGSMDLSDGPNAVTKPRKRRALQYAAEAGGYEWRWGDVGRFVHEADGALLDFHGPWAGDKRRIVQAARHMTAVVVVLVPSHDVSSDASSAHERQMAYQLFLKMSWSDKPRWEAITAGGHVRRLTDYHEDQGRHVFVYLLARRHVKLPTRLTINQRAKMRRDVAERVKATQRRHYQNLDAVGKANWNARTRCSEHRRTGQLPLRPCSSCGAVRGPQPCQRIDCPGVVPIERQRGPKWYCSPECTHSVRMAAQQARRARAKLTAVSGTAAEAISMDEAA